MADNSGNEAKKNLKEINDIVRAIDSGFSSLSNNLQDITSDLKNATGQARAFNSIQRDINNSITQISKNNEKLIKNQIALNNGQLSSKIINKQIQEITAAREVLGLRLNRLQDQQNNGIALTKKQKQEIKKLEEQLSESSQEVLNNYQGQLDQVKKIETKLGIFGRLAKGLGKIPLVGDLLDAEGALEAMNKSALAGKSLFTNLGAGIKAAFSGIEKSSVILAVVSALYKAINFFVDALVGADKRVTDIAKNLSISKESARDVYQSFINSKSSLDAQLSTTKNIVEAFNDLTELSEFSVLATQKQIDNQIILTKEIGVSKEGALGFQEALIVSNTESEKGVSIVYDQIAAFANQNKIVANGRKIFEEIAKTSKLIQINFRGNFKSLIDSTLQANKLGLSLDQVSKVGESLLNFEQSISSELEAELLTGRNLNLEKARLFALNHDIAGLTQEIANQGITISDFTAMNVIQQEAIAKSLGMSANELGESLYKQEKITKAAGNYTNELRKQGKIKEAQALEQGILDGYTLQQAQRSLDIQTKFNTALEQVQEIFSDLVSGGIIDDLVNMLIAFTKSVQIKGFKSTLAGGIDEAAQREADLMQAKRKTQNISVSAIGKKSESEQQADVIALMNKKQILEKQIEEAPGWFDKINYAINEATGFDPLDVNKRIAEEKRQGIQAQQQLPEVEKLLRELIATAKSGGNVYLDSTKVGTAQGLTAYRQ